MLYYITSISIISLYEPSRICQFTILQKYAFWHLLNHVATESSQICQLDDYDNTWQTDQMTMAQMITWYVNHTGKVTCFITLINFDLLTARTGICSPKAMWQWTCNNILPANWLNRQSLVREKSRSFPTFHSSIQFTSLTNRLHITCWGAQLPVFYLKKTEKSVAPSNSWSYPNARVG